VKNLLFFYSTVFFYSFICLFTFSGCEKYPEKIQANLNKLKSTNSCQGCDLTGVVLVDFDLKNVNLSGFANLSRADLTNADLTNGNLTAAGLTEANLTGTNLTGANLAGANLTGANLTGANLTEANLTGAILTDEQLSLLESSGLLIGP